ncbi:MULTISPECIES: hypothetical protein [unclassified Roseitalea]|nr:MULTISPECIES: hypothetical protein [unclassified Roseitalea]
MSIFARLFGHRADTHDNLATVLERRRLARTMPGETGARAGSRYGFIIN